MIRRTPRGGSSTSQPSILDGSEEEEHTPTVQVTCRLRPLNEKELANPNTNVPWEYSKTSIRVRSQGAKKTFTFDHVLSPETMNEECYDQVGKIIVEKAMAGFNATIFAYGQTGSGKTWTMMGDGARGMEGKEKGLLPRAMHNVFKYKNDHPDRIFLLRVSYMEIYNEEINDLLGREASEKQGKDSEKTWKNLRIVKSDPVRGAIISGLSEYIVESADHALEILENGDKVRNIAGTEMNARSSRSHTIFRLVIESSLSEEAKTKRDLTLAKFKDEGEQEEEFVAVKKSKDASDSDVCVSYLNLVDLAGSERQGSTQAQGARLKEGANINKSLLALGAVIHKLTEKTNSESNSRHIPYRNSKLTRILKTSLGGSTFTHVILAATPSPTYIEETLSTLKFGAMCKLMKNTAKVNKGNSQDSMLNQYKLQILKLKEELSTQVEHIGGVNSEELQQAKEEAERRKQETDDLKERLKQMEQALSKNSGAHSDGRGNIMVKSSLNYAGARIVSGKHSPTKEKSPEGYEYAGQDPMDVIKELESTKATQERELVELRERIGDLEHETESLRTEAEESSATMEEFQQMVEELAERSNHEAEERQQMEELVVAKDKKISRDELEITDLSEQVRELKTRIQAKEKEEGIIHAQQAELRSKTFVMKWRKKSLENMLHEIIKRQEDHDHGAAVLEYEIQKQEESLHQMKEDLATKHNELHELIVAQHEEHSKKLALFRQREDQVHKSEQAANELKATLEERLRTLNHEIQIQSILPALQQRVRKGQMERLRKNEKKLQDREMELEARAQQLISEHVAQVEVMQTNKIENERLLVWEQKLIDKTEQLETELLEFNRSKEDAKLRDLAFNKEKQDLQLRLKDAQSREASFVEMERILLQREAEINVLKSSVETDAERHRGLEEKQKLREKELMLEKGYMERTRTALRDRASMLEKRERDIVAKQSKLDHDKASLHEEATVAKKVLETLHEQVVEKKYEVSKLNEEQQRLEKKDAMLQEREHAVLKLEHRSRVHAEKEHELNAKEAALNQREKSFFNENAALIHIEFQHRMATLEKDLNTALDNAAEFKRRLQQREALLASLKEDGKADVDMTEEVCSEEDASAIHLINDKNGQYGLEKLSEEERVVTEWQEGKYFAHTSEDDRLSTTSSKRSVVVDISL
jgi:centromeric protein E